MADVHDSKTRSFNMSQIKGKNTSPELLVRKYLFSHGLRYRIHVKSLPGKPDIVLSKYKTIIFVHGCFWHGHDNCKKFVIPQTRTDWWMEKISKNKSNDQLNTKLLEKCGWSVIQIFECELSKSSINTTLEKLLVYIRK